MSYCYSGQNRCAIHKKEECVHPEIRQGRAGHEIGKLGNQKSNNGDLVVMMFYCSRLLYVCKIRSLRQTKRSGNQKSRGNVQ